MFIETLRVRDAFGIRVDSLEHYPACSFPNDTTRTAFGKRKCSAGVTSATIGFEGDIRPCSHAPETYGNILDGGLAQSWTNMHLWRSGELVPSTCLNCPEHPKLCSGGCRVEAKIKGGSYTHMDPFFTTTNPTTKMLPTKRKPLPKYSIVKPKEDLKFREESFGYLAYLDTTSWLLIDTTLYAIMSSRTGFGTQEVAKAFNISEENAKKTIDTLLRKRLAETVS